MCKVLSGLGPSNSHWASQGVLWAFARFRVQGLGFRLPKLVQGSRITNNKLDVCLNDAGERSSWGALSCGLYVGHFGSASMWHAASRFGSSFIQ